MNLKTNDSGQIVFDNWTVKTVKDRESIAQNIRANIRTWKGEYFLNKVFGVDYLRGFQKGQQKFLLFAIKKAILETVGVIKINTLDFTLVNRAGRINAEVQTEAGTIKYRDEVVI